MVPKGSPALGAIRAAKFAVALRVRIQLAPPDILDSEDSPLGTREIGAWAASFEYLVTPEKRAFQL
jgi:hypothetical protein